MTNCNHIAKNGKSVIIHFKEKDVCLICGEEWANGEDGKLV
jgi:hypothetical protein